MNQQPFCSTHTHSRLHWCTHCCETGARPATLHLPHLHVLGLLDQGNVFSSVMKDPARHLYRKGQGQQKLTWLSFCLSWLQLLPVFPAHSCSTLYYLPFPITCPADFKLYIRLELRLLEKLLNLPPQLQVVKSL